MTCRKTVNAKTSTSKSLNMRPVRTWIVLALLLCVSPVVADSPTTQPAASRHDVHLVTLGPGDEVWERFGHVMLDVREPELDVDWSVNWGIFDFDQPGFFWRFVQGRMLYTTGAFRPGLQPQGALVEYKELDRAITLQRVLLTDAQFERLFVHLADNLREGHRDYRYDYYRDNCSTRVRDALDVAFAGDIKAKLEKLPADPPTTYRVQTRRLMQDDFWVALGANFAMGPAGDRPLTAWEDCFIPMQMAKYVTPWVAPAEHPWTSRRPPEHQDVPDYTLAMGLIGVALAASAIALVRSRHRLGRVLAWVVASSWLLLSGLGGILLVFMWLATDHWATYRNENLLAYSPLAMALLLMMPFKKLRGQSWMTWVSLTIVATTVLAIIGKLTPWMIQGNGQFLALALPLNVMIWWVFRSRKEQAI